jgi:hypothetical protein
LAQRGANRPVNPATGVPGQASHRERGQRARSARESASPEVYAATREVSRATPDGERPIRDIARASPDSDARNLVLYARPRDLSRREPDIERTAHTIERASPDVCARNLGV